MAKKTKTTKTPTRGGTAKKQPAGKTSAPKTTVLLSGPKYDQPGAPWWKKFPTPSHG